MTDVVERAKAVLEHRDTRIGHGLVRDLVAEVERLRTWDGLLSLLDEHYPESVFPTADDREDRDPGPRIISLIRQINQIRAADR